MFTFTFRLNLNRAELQERLSVLSTSLSVEEIHALIGVWKCFLKLESNWVYIVLFCCFVLLLFSTQLHLVLFCCFVLLLVSVHPTPSYYAPCSLPCCLVAPHDGLSASRQTFHANKKNSNSGEIVIFPF